MSEDQTQSHRETSQDAPRAWQRMLSGRRLDLLCPDPKDIDVNDIAHGLARVARWNGQTHGTHAFSVAQHSLIVEMICADQNPDWPNEWRLAALLHDAAEYVIGDLISPFKANIGESYKAIEIGLLEAIHQSVGLPKTLPTEITKAIKEGDHVSAYFEATRLAGFSEKEALQYFGNADGITGDLLHQLSNLKAASTQDAQTMFLEKFCSLTNNPLTSKKESAGAINE